MTGCDCLLEGDVHTKSIGGAIMRNNNEGTCLKIPRPREESRDLLKSAQVRRLLVLPHRAASGGERTSREKHSKIDDTPRKIRILVVSSSMVWGKHPIPLHGLGRDLEGHRGPSRFQDAPSTSETTVT